jgi:hypothetical protein
VEWGDVVSAALGDHLEVRLELLDDGSEDAADGEPSMARLIHVAPSGVSWVRRWDTVSKLLTGLDVGRSRNSSDAC